MKISKTNKVVGTFLLFIAILLVFMVLPYLDHAFHERDPRRVDRIRTAIYGLSSYKHRCGVYPTTEEGLIKLKSNIVCPDYTPSPQVMRSDFTDLDGNPFIYESDGKTFKFFLKGSDMNWGPEEKWLLEQDKK